MVTYYNNSTPIALEWTELHAKERMENQAGERILDYSQISNIIRDFRPFLFFYTSLNILSLAFRLEFTEKKGANRIKIGPQLKKLF